MYTTKGWKSWYPGPVWDVQPWGWVMLPGGSRTAPSLVTSDFPVCLAPILPFYLLFIPKSNLFASSLRIFLDGKEAFKGLGLDLSIWEKTATRSRVAMGEAEGEATCCVSVSFVLCNKNAGRSTVAANSGGQIAISLVPKYLHFVGQKNNDGLLRLVRSWRAD